VLNTAALRDVDSVDDALPGAPSWAYALLVGLILALQFGPAIGLAGFNLSGDERWALNGAARDLLVLLLFAAGLAARTGRSRRGPLPPSARWALAMIAVYAVMALLSSSSLFVLALNLRRIALVPLLFAALLMIPWTPGQIGRALGLIVTTSLIVAAVGLFERLMPDSFWFDVLDIETYTASNPLDPWAKVGFYDNGRFFTWDLAGWTGASSRRMVSTYLEPTTFAAGMAVLTTMGLARIARGRSAPLLLMLGTVCGIATLSKGFALFLILLLAWRLFGFPGPRHVLALVAGTSGVALAAAATGHLEGPFSHISGLASGLYYLLEGNLLGEGIGAAGGYSDVENDVGHESGLGTAIGQVGLAALLPLLWVRSVARETLHAAAARGDPGGPWLASWLVFWTVTFLLSASSLGVGGNALGFMALALYLRRGGHGDLRWRA
jgi:hypothetical protein